MTTEPKRRRWRRKISLALACLAMAVGLAFFGGWMWLRSEKFNGYVAEEIKKKLTEFGLRAEVGSFGFSWDSETARLKDLKVYNQQTGQLIATVGSIEVQTHIRDLYAPKLSREVEIKNLNLDSVEVFVEIDEQGRSNLEGVHNAPPKSQTIKFDTTKLLTALTNTGVHYKDRQHKIEADLAKLKITAQPSTQQPQIFNLQLETESGQVAVEGRETTISKFSLTAKASASEVEIEQLQLNSGLGEVTAKGKVEDFGALKYGFDLESKIRLDELATFAFPEVLMRGLAAANGKLEGEGEKYKFSGSVSVADLLVENTRLRGVQLPQVTVNGAGNNLKLAVNRANVQTINVDIVEVSGTTVSNIKGEIKINGKATESNFDSAMASVAAVTWTDSKLSNLTISNLATTVQGRNYKVTGDARLPGGSISGIEFSQASAKTLFDNSALAVTEIKASALGGSAEAEYTLPMAKSAPQQIKGKFTEIQTAEALAAFKVSGKDIPVSGKASGTVDLGFLGADPRTIEGKISAQFEGKSSQSTEAIPLTGEVEITAANGLFTFEKALLSTQATKLTATGKLNYQGESDLRISLASSQAEELIQIARSVEQARPFIVENEPQLIGELKFDGRITGKLDNAIVDGDVSAATVGLRDALIGALSGHVTASSKEFKIEKGLLTALNGGSAKFDLFAPLDPKAETGSLTATINRISLETILAATGLPDAGDFISGDISGNTNLTGLPGTLRGEAKISLVEGKIAQQDASLATADLKFDGQQALLELLEVQLPKSHLTATGSFHMKDYIFQAQGKADQIGLDSIAESFELKDTKIEGFADANFQVTGKLDKPDQSRKQPELDWESFKLELNATGKNVRVNGRDTGELRLTAHTSPGGRLDAELLTGILAAVTQDKAPGAFGKPEKLKASVELRKPGRPVVIESDLSDLDLTPFIATFAPDLKDQLRGIISGRLHIEGLTTDSTGKATADLLSGGLTLTTINLDVLDNPVTIPTPLTISLASSQLKLPSTQITGLGLDLNLGGAIGLKDQAAMNFDLNGKARLDRLPELVTGLALFGELNIAANLTGTAEKPALGGAVDLKGFGFSSSDLPIFVSGGKGRVKLSGDQLTVESFIAEANDGSLEISGGMKLVDLRPAEWKFDIKGYNAEIFYDEFTATVNGVLTLTGTPEKQLLAGTILVPLGEYETQIDLDNLLGGGSANLSFGGFSGESSSAQRSIIPPISLDLHVEARDSLLVRGKQINAVGSANFTVGGTLSDPDARGRIETESGSVRFRGQRYEIIKGTLDLPVGGGEPVLNLLAESDISGYHVYLDMAGQTDTIELKLRAEPQLTRDEILSLITTGRTETGTIGNVDPLRTGVGAAASLLSSGFISKPTEQLLGLSRFQIDPVIRPNANPAARLTVGQQISRNFYLSYSTNLATEQDQTALAEYTFSNRFSALATYTQGGSAARQGVREGVFTIELRGRQRFSLGFIAPAPAVITTTPTTTNTRPILPAAQVKVSPIPDLKLDGKQLRELLPVMTQGFSRSLARLGERRLKEYLQEQGYFFAEVSWRCEPVDCAPGKDLHVQYDVQPNLIYDLKEIRIEGTKLISWQDLRGDLQSQIESKVGGIPFLKNIPYIGGTVRGLTSNSRLSSDEEYIRRYLVDVGYRNAHVKSRLAVRPDSDDLIVIYDVEEGQQSDIADVVLRGNSTITASELRQAVPVQKDEAFSLTRARLGAQAIKRLYAERGFLEATAEMQIVELDEDSVQLVYQISEGSRAIISRIDIKGTTKTGHGWIRRYLDFKPGEVLTPTKIAQTQRDLYATNAFREVAIRTEPENGQPGSNDSSAHKVTLNLTEAKPLLFVYGLGYSTDDGARGLMEIANTNLGGSLDALSLRLRASQRQKFAQLSFTDLRPFGMRLPTTISFFYDRNSNLLPFARRQQIRDGKLEDVPNSEPFGLDRFAAFIQTERKLSDRTSLRFRYNLERAKLFNTANLPDTEITRNEQAIRLGMFSVGFTRDTRDNVLNPSSGQLISADHSIASKLFGGNESFNKFFGTYQRYKTFASYTPLLRDTTFAFSARIGMADTFSNTDRNNDMIISESETRLPISERFFSGGATTLRGFRFETAGPQDVLFDPAQNPKPGEPFILPTLIPVGGDALAVFNFEMRYPLTQRLRLVPFYDLGNVFRRIDDISWKGMTHTVGAGLRINTPLGPVGVDYGFLLNPPAFAVPGLPGTFLRQPRGAIHIRLGQTF
ncbi:MAG: translocation/assembly module TamB domain-containing protein [Acidobacteria bacterium]|nr:translocation/assembly module TamB domain-containing protein [Acidobacteriota bacterium]